MRELSVCEHASVLKKNFGISENKKQTLSEWEQMTQLSSKLYLRTLTNKGK